MRVNKAQRSLPRTVPGAALAFGIGLPPAADGLEARVVRRARTLGALEGAPEREDGERERAEARERERRGERKSGRHPPQKILPARSCAPRRAPPDWKSVGTIQQSIQSIQQWQQKSLQAPSHERRSPWIDMTSQSPTTLSLSPTSS